MAIHNIQIGKNRFVCGLFWQSLSRPRELLKEAAGLAKRIDCDLMVLRKNQTTAQAGFAHSRDGARPNACSLAAAVSETLALEGARYDGELQEVHNWLGAFKLPDGKWAYFAVRDANFLPNGDFAGTQEEVLDRLLGDYALGGWNVVIGDADLAGHGFHNFIAKPIETLIPHKKNGQVRVARTLMLRPVQKKVPWRMLGAASLALAIGAAAAGYAYQRKQAEAERLRRIEEAARQAQGKPVKKAPLPHPWRTKPVPVALAQACVDKLTRVSAGGWHLDNYTCSASRASYSWVRDLSTVDFLKAHVPDALVEMNGNRALQTVPLQLPADLDETLLGSAQLIEPLISRLQMLGVGLQFKKEPAPAPPPPSSGDDKNAVPLPDWQTYSFVVNGGGLPPGELAAIFDLPGVRIEKLAYQGGSWTVEGVIYAK